MSANLLRQPSNWFETVPSSTAARASDLGPTLVVAPHPDDEVLGCGGVIALLRQAGIPVHVVVVSDGAASHPGSKAYPPTALARLRRTESQKGLALLGMTPMDVTFLGLPDGAVPQPHDPSGSQAVGQARDVLRWRSDFETVLLPWRRDPHPDHQATWALFTSALNGAGSPARRLEYPIWSRVRPQPGDLSRDGEVRAWRLDIAGVSDLKRMAILAHQSQTTGLIDDADISECLTPDVLARFFQPWEPYMDVRTEPFGSTVPGTPGEAAP